MNAEKEISKGATQIKSRTGWEVMKKAYESIPNLESGAVQLIAKLVSKLFQYLSTRKTETIPIGKANYKENSILN